MVKVCHSKDFNLLVYQDKCLDKDLVSKDKYMVRQDKDMVSKDKYMVRQDKDTVCKDKCMVCQVKCQVVVYHTTPHPE